MKTILCTVLVEKVWDNRTNRYALRGETVEFPAEVKNHKGEVVPITINPETFKPVEGDKPAKAAKSKASDDLV